MAILMDTPLYLFGFASLIIFVSNVFAACPKPETTATFRENICKRSLPDGKFCMCSTNGDHSLELLTAIPMIGWIPLACASMIPRSLMSKNHLNSMKLRFRAADVKRKYILMLIEPDGAIKPHVRCLWTKTLIPGSQLRAGLEKFLWENDTLPYMQPQPPTEYQKQRVRRFQFYLFATGTSTPKEFVDEATRGELNWVYFLNRNALCDSLVGGYQMNVDEQHISFCNPDATCEPACGRSVLCMGWRSVSCGDPLTLTNWRKLKNAPIVTFRGARKNSLYQVTIFVDDGTRSTLVWNLRNVKGERLLTGTKQGAIVFDYKLPAFQKNKTYTLHAHLTEQMVSFLSNNLLEANVSVDVLRTNLDAKCQSILATFRLGGPGKEEEEQVKLDMTSENFPGNVASGPDGVDPPREDYSDDVEPVESTSDNDSNDSSVASILFFSVATLLFSGTFYKATLRLE